MEFLSQLFWSAVLLMFILAFFGKMVGVNMQGIIKTYLNMVGQILIVVGEVLTKVAIPILKQLGEKIVYTANQYINEQKSQQPQIKDDKPVNKETMSGSSEQPIPKPTPQPAQKPQPKPNSANPYDDPPEPEIMD